MSDSSPDALLRRAMVARTLKAIRKRRGLTAAAVADALGMKLRTFQHFEAGHEEKINVERIYAVAEVLEVDALSILIAMELEAPDFAVNTADNSLVSVILLGLRDLNEAHGRKLARVDTRTLISVFRKAFDELTKLAGERNGLGGWPKKPPPDKS